MEQNTIKRVLDFYLKDKSYNKDIKNAFSKFFSKYAPGPEDESSVYEQGALSEWMLFNFKLKNGRTFLEEYRKTNPEGLNSKKLRVYKELCDSVFGLWKVKNVIKGVGLELVNERDKKTYNVSENQGSMSLKKGDYIFGRVGEVCGIFELVGSDPFAVSKEAALRILKEIKDLNPKTVRDYFYKTKEKSVEGMEDSILDGNKCRCSRCGKIGVMGGVLNPTEAFIEASVVCRDCMDKIAAVKEGVTVQEIQKQRQDRMENLQLFLDVMSERYFKDTGKKSYDSEQEETEVMNMFMKAWSSQPPEFTAALEMADRETVRKAFLEFKFDFKRIHSIFKAKTGKIGRNDSCPCGSGKKYKYCCGIN